MFPAVAKLPPTVRRSPKNHHPNHCAAKRRCSHRRNLKSKSAAPGARPIWSIRSRHRDPKATGHQANCTVPLTVPSRTCVVEASRHGKSRSADQSPYEGETSLADRRDDIRARRASNLPPSSASTRFQKTGAAFACVTPIDRPPLFQVLPFSATSGGSGPQRYMCTSCDAIGMPRFEAVISRDFTVRT